MSKTKCRAKVKRERPCDSFFGGDVVTVVIRALLFGMRKRGVYTSRAGVGAYRGVEMRIFVVSGVAVFGHVPSTLPHTASLLPRICILATPRKCIFEKMRILTAAIAAQGAAAPSQKKTQ